MRPKPGRRASRRCFRSPPLKAPSGRRRSWSWRSRRSPRRPSRAPSPSWSPRRAAAAAEPAVLDPEGSRAGRTCRSRRRRPRPARTTSRPRRGPSSPACRRCRRGRRRRPRAGRGRRRRRRWRRRRPPARRPRAGRSRRASGEASHRDDGNQRRNHLAHVLHQVVSSRSERSQRREPAMPAAAREARKLDLGLGRRSAARKRECKQEPATGGKGAGTRGRPPVGGIRSPGAGARRDPLREPDDRLATRVAPEQQAGKQCQEGARPAAGRRPELGHGGPG